MADADGAAPPPPTCPRLVLAADDAVVFIWLSCVWILVASVAAIFIEVLACGMDIKCQVSPVGDAAFRLGRVAWWFFWIFRDAARYLSNWVPSSNTEEEKGLSIKMMLQEQGLSIQSIFVVVIDYVEPFLLLTGAGILLMLLICYFIESLMIKIGIVTIYAVPVLGISAIACFIVIPAGALWIWRVRKATRRYHHAFLVSTICYDPKQVLKKFRCFAEQEIEMTLLSPDGARIPNRRHSPRLASNEARAANLKRRKLQGADKSSAARAVPDPQAARSDAEGLPTGPLPEELVDLAR